MMRARGDGFFAAADTQPYQQRGVLFGQETGDSCVAACCRMLLLDQLPEAHGDYRYSESFLRTALATEHEGTFVARVPQVLQDFGHPARYEYRRDLTVAALLTATADHPLIAIVSSTKRRAHALLVDKVVNELVAVRDPLPEARGAAYQLTLDSFLTHWLHKKTGYGRAILVVK